MMISADMTDENDSLTMNETLLRLFENGDLDSARQHLLHTTAWTQHGRTAFGDEQITRQWLRWQALCGKSRCLEQKTLSGEGQRLFLFTMQPEDTSSQVHLGLWTWTNERHWRRVTCIMNTKSIALARNMDEREVFDLLPDADPLIIGDYDQSLHPHLVDAAPTQLATLPQDMAEVVDGWWKLWTRTQLDQIEKFWAPGAHAHVPGSPDVLTRDGLHDWFTRFVTPRHRRFCQPESVLYSPGAVAILWHMDCDWAPDKTASNPQRVRIPMLSMLDIEDHRITREILISDQLATHKAQAA